MIVNMMDMVCEYMNNVIVVIVVVVVDCDCVVLLIVIVLLLNRGCFARFSKKFLAVHFLTLMTQHP